MKLTPNSMPAIDVRFHHGIYKQGDITVALSWYLVDGDPCIVLFPTNRQLHFEKVRPCVVTLDGSWKWDEERGDAAYADRMAAEFAACLGMNPLQKTNILRVQSIIRDFLHELVKMPPLPDEHRQKVADLFVTDNTTGAITHKEVKDYV